MSNEQHRTPRSVTISQNGQQGISVTNDFRSEEVTDVITMFALGLKAIALSVQEQTGMPASATIAVVAQFATADGGFIHRTDWKDDDAESPENTND